MTFLILANTISNTNYSRIDTAVLPIYYNNNINYRYIDNTVLKYHGTYRYYPRDLHKVNNCNVIY